MRLPIILLLTSLAWLVSIATGVNPASEPSATQPTQAKKLDYNRDIRPILSQHCFPCHGTDRAAVEKTGGLRLDSFEFATADRDGKTPIKPGSVEDSWIFNRIEAPVEELRMPPKGPTAKPLSAEQIAILKQWIKEGANYAKHWSFEPIKRPALPAVQDKSWPKNEFDYFTLAQMEANGLQPEPEADKRTLIRRATLALIGLPPTPEEIAAFLNDKSPDAYEKVVDRLLADQRYGEHMATPWLDAVRYADTHGLHIDNYREVFPYRDWVVRALNDDLPFNEFLTWQLAGDLLPKPTTDQLIATGYLRMNPTTNEGGVIVEEFLAKNTFDRAETTATVFLGLTFTCARCHDHKYDPITHEEYYKFYAYFNSTSDDPLDGNLNLHPPVMPAPTPEQSRVLAGYESKLAQLRQTVSLADARVWAEQEQARTPVMTAWSINGPYQAESFDKAFDTVYDPEPGSNKTDVIWKEFSIEEGKAKSGIINKDNAAAYVRTWLHVETAVDIEIGVGSDDAIKIWNNGKLVHSNKVLRGLTIDEDKVKLSLTPGRNEIIFKVVNGAGPDSLSVTLGARRGAILREVFAAIKSGDSTPESQNKLRDAFLLYGPGGGVANEYREFNSKRLDLLASLPQTYIARELAKPRVVKVLRRGEYDQPEGDPIERGFPAVVSPQPSAAPRSRMDLANWLTSRDNPLLGRVVFNRIWQTFFGLGIVTTPEDFGSQGQMPSHPDLLDFGASELTSHWSQKKLHRMIVTSATFRQSAKVDQAKFEKDPKNIFLSRGPRFRLSAEVIRDQALMVSGLLVQKMGGKGVKPYQPPGLWEAIGFNGVSDTAVYVQDKGEALYRRSLYLFIKRTLPPPVLGIFDAPSREACTVFRAPTNTPTQALTTMNETAFFEAARHLAQRTLQAPGNDQKRLAVMFERVTGRLPAPNEQVWLLDFLNRQRKSFEAQPGAAEKSLMVGESPRDTNLPANEHAAWTLLANLILNLDEALTQH
ncbi:PSD1 and planctomycete cytochrome C domain-containing protein [Kamptonema cortianum]|nr:PSD1 and planctomycete cytochrome C domain-containing protein [Geitlerinema splendidum]MDK3155337.1 PSD1 and planctomycete cytochrome C domain-containing protein [Kamptonema cortianum]